MPHATAKYGFEFRVAGWVAGFSARLTGRDFVPCLIIFSPDGRAETVLFGHAPEQHDHISWEAARKGKPSWLLYDPFDGPVYTWVSWQQLPRTLAERLMGASFQEADFVAGGQSIPWPETWGVMF